MMDAVMHDIATAAAEWAVNNGHAHCTPVHREYVFGVYYDLMIATLAAYEAELVKARSSMPEPSLN
jgi:hypothetical protein